MYLLVGRGENFSSLTPQTFYALKLDTFAKLIALHHSCQNFAQRGGWWACMRWKYCRLAAGLEWISLSILPHKQTSSPTFYDNLLSMRGGYRHPNTPNYKPLLPSLLDALARKFQWKVGKRCVPFMRFFQISCKKAGIVGSHNWGRMSQDAL